MREKKPIKFLTKVKLFFFPLWDNKVTSLQLSFYFIIETSFGVLFIFFIKYLTESLELGDKDTFFYMLCIFTAIYTFLFVLKCVFYKLGWPGSYNKYRISIEEKYLPQYIEIDNNFYEKIGTGKSIAIISKGVKIWGTLLGDVVNKTTVFCISLFLTIYFLSTINSYFIILLIILLISGQVIGIFLNSYVVDIRKSRIELDNIWAKQVVRIIMSKMEVLQSKKIDKELLLLNELHEGQIYYNEKMAPFLTAFFLIGDLITFILLVTIYIYFGNMYFEGQISFGLIAGISGAILMMQQVFINTLEFFKNFTRDFAEVQNFLDFFDQAPTLEGYHNGKPFIYKTGEIEVKNIQYGYTPDKNIFNNFSLTFQATKITALVGPSGGGKTTLAKLIAGYIQPNNGEVFVDNQDLKKVSLKTYYKSIGYLTQEPSVFDGTILENLMYGAEAKVSKTKLKEAINLAHCEFIYDLPKGIDTEIGERGVKLSGGQKQRLAIAKIILKNPYIIILDEPTSALDSFSEEKVSKAFSNLFVGRTVMVIAHRLQTVKKADEIIVIESGKVIERGNHNNLVKKGGYYKKMLDLQSGF